MVYYYHQLFSKKQLPTICEECKKGERGCVNCKKELVENLLTELKEVRERRNYYENHMDEVKKILQEGSAHAKKRAEENIKEIKEAMKINYFNEKDISN